MNLTFEQQLSGAFLHAFVRHQLDNNMKNIVEKSLMHCHCRHVHSVMLLECPEQTIRLFVADENHELYHNFPLDVNPGGGTFKLSPQSTQTTAFHPHHCNLSLSVIKGRIFNWVVKEFCSKCDEDQECESFEIQKYFYRSKINTGQMMFTPCGTTKMRHMGISEYPPYHTVHMPADMIHTVAVEKGHVAAWIVMEGKEDPKYQPYCYSAYDLSNSDFSRLYKKCTKNSINYILELAGLV